LLPPSVVAAISPAPDVLTPAAKQSALVGHDTPRRSPILLGSTCACQVAPPSLVATTDAAPPDAFTPTAQHALLVGHDTPERVPVAAGRAWVCQLSPASEVTAMAPMARTGLVCPTAQQSVLVGHETLDALSR
jgi:hypothetical protein